MKHRENHFRHTLLTSSFGEGKITGIIEPGEPVLYPRSIPGHPPIDCFVRVQCDSCTGREPGLCLDAYGLLMHQSIPPAPSPPGQPRDIYQPCQSRGRSFS